ncbi:MAG: DASS family sodium-coupled anion symporter [Candidatus Aenigmarchaeota archaeon]|nr:DASS family sodium-coupled anion symporter [Candidatus Aenigmarchaeota archaeon]
MRHEIPTWSIAKKILFVIAGILFSTALSSYFLGFGSPQQIVFTITFTALFMWLSEIVPLHITALFIPFLLVIFGGFKPAEAFSPFFDSVVVLVLGGFVIALALSKYKVDEYIGHKLVHRGSSPRIVLFSMIGVTAFISMWMANSAAAAMMMPIGLIILKSNKMLPGKSSFGKSLVLGIGFAATIGGLGTMVGSTPNVLVAKFLNQAGYSFGFMDWTYYGFPMMVALICSTFIILTFLFKPEVKKINMQENKRKLNMDQKKVLAIFAITIMLWVTTEIHKMDIGTISLVPVFLLFGLGLLKGDDFKKIDWPSLILIGGGISLGFAMHASALDVTMANAIGNIISGQGALLIALVIITFGVALTAFASNTAAASVIVPMMIPLAVATGINPRMLAMLAGVGVSLDFIMPSGTPPTTIAYSTNYVKLRDLLKAGLLVSIAAIFICSFIAIAI